MFASGLLAWAVVLLVLATCWSLKLFTKACLSLNRNCLSEEESSQLCFQNKSNLSLDFAIRKMMQSRQISCSSIQMQGRPRFAAGALVLLLAFLAGPSRERWLCARAPEWIRPIQQCRHQRTAVSQTADQNGNDFHHDFNDEVNFHHLLQANIFHQHATSQLPPLSVISFFCCFPPFIAQLA